MTKIQNSKNFKNLKFKKKFKNANSTYSTQCSKVHNLTAQVQCSNAKSWPHKLNASRLKLDRPSFSPTPIQQKILKKK